MTATECDPFVCKIDGPDDLCEYCRSQKGTQQSPCDRWAEKAVLGAILRNSKSLDAIDFLEPADFFMFGHQKIFAAMRDLHARGIVPDAVTVSDWCHSRGLTADVGGDVYFADLFEEAPSWFNAGRHGKIVKAKAILRGLVHAGQEITRDALGSVDSPEGLLDSAREKILDLCEEATFEPKHIEEVRLRTLDLLNDRTIPGRRDGAVLSGLLALDEYSGGFQPGQLIVVAARTSVGKTQFALNVAWNASDTGQVILLFSLEQPAEEIGYRLLALTTGINSRKFARPTLLTEMDAKLLGESQFIGRSIYIQDARSQNLLRISASARRQQRKTGLDLIIVDYLQFVVPDDPRAARHEQVATITRRLKDLALELKIPVMVLAQLNREADKKDEVPKLSHLRESGSIEQDADTVLLLYRPETLAAPKNCLSIVVAKQRNGATGQVDFYYDKTTGKISDLTLM